MTNYSTANISYLLDTNVIIRFPELLAQSVGNICILDAVIDELSRAPRSLGNLLETAIRTSLVRVEEFEGHVDSRISLKRRLSLVDALQISFATQAASKGKTIILVTDDRAMREVAREVEIESISANEFRELVKNSPITSKKVATEARNYNRISSLIGIGNLVFAAFTATAANFTWSNISWIIDYAPFLAVVVMMPAIGVFLFWMRGKTPLAYGMAELIIGIFSGVNVVLKYGPDLSSAERTTMALQLVAGVYIIVRGLDNIGKGVKDTRYEAAWLRVFPK